MKKIIASALIAATMLVGLTSCSKSGSDKKQFVVGFDSEFPPMGFVADDGSYTGFDLDVAREVANRLDMEFVATPIDWNSKDLELSSGNIDCIWNGFTMTADRINQYAWTTPYMNNAQVVVVSADSSITSLADLEGAVICAQRDSSGLDALYEAGLDAIASEVVEVDTYLNAMMQLGAEGVDAIVMDEIVARYEIENSDYNFVVLDEALAPEEYGVGFALDNTELRDQVQTVLEEMAADGTLAEISTRWFGTDITTIGK